jgi:histidinol-phosphate/aromatic aminotransferase/cobyric acid decarboxylase-like protein
MSPEGREAARHRTERLIAERGRLLTALAKAPEVERVYPSEANFLLLKAKSSARIMDRCRRQGIVVRDRSSDRGLENSVRVTVGTPEENDAVTRALGGTSVA